MTNAGLSKHTSSKHRWMQGWVKIGLYVRWRGRLGAGMGEEGVWSKPQLQIEWGWLSPSHLTPVPVPRGTQRGRELEDWAEGQEDCVGLTRKTPGTGPCELGL